MVLDEGIAEKLLKLPFAPHRFFLLPDDAVFVPAARLALSRCRPDGVLHANEFMMKAYRNEIAKRAPVSVRPLGRGRFEVLDGNSTTVNCLFSGWAAIPVTIARDAP
jgi:hypothetical protein